jgi:hypothetical protein
MTLVRERKVAPCMGIVIIVPYLSASSYKGAFKKRFQLSASIDKWLYSFLLLYHDMGRIMS